ncbi:DEAD/DEAH box helicase [Marinobacter sp.]|uniref:DEAD/DEAH box helicase n=1 Tax=Marinobacter sp. TaxID=50741 RepID=UPI003A8E5850
MTNFSTKLAEKIIGGNGYHLSTASLFSCYVDRMIGGQSSLERLEIKKLVAAAQIFQKSEDINLQREGAAVLSMLLDVCAEEHKDLVVIARTMFTSGGDFPNVELLKRRFEDVEFERSIYSQAQADFRRSINTVESLSFPLTDYQRALWNDLSSDQDVITVAPTSAGKTHIILSYLVKKVSESEGAFAAIIVPTRALISEVAGTLYELIQEKSLDEKMEVCTIAKDGSFSPKTFFVVTQERLYEILQRGDVSFDYLFIDEAHNISDKSRGVLLHLTIDRMLDDSNPQVIVSMPSPNYQNAFSSVFKDVDFKRQVTSHSPVAKILISVVPKGRDLIVSRYGSGYSKKIPKNFSQKRLSDIVYRLGRNQSNIIYRNQTDHCESIANELASLIGGTESNDVLEEAADYVEEFVHNDFSLARNLRKGVAFHYGPLPSSIRVMVENLAKDNLLNFIACTSTLAEGVNLPAKNLFLKNPLQRVMHKPSERIDDVKINNITGRAGRMLQHFSGNVFLIEPDDWTFPDYFEAKEEVNDKIPSFYKTMNEDFGSIIQALEGSFAHDDNDQYRIYTIANKLVKEYSSGRLEKVLSAEELTLSDSLQSKLKSAVEFAYASLKVTPFTLEANPTVGYIQQNKLYEFLQEQKNFERWLLPYPKSVGIYQVLVDVSRKLQEYGVYIPSDSYSIEHICLIAKKWMQGLSLREIVSDQIRWDKERAGIDNVNGSVRSVIKIINNDVRFRLSNALRCYDILLTSVLQEHGVDSYSAKLHSFLEIGGCDERMVFLINLGLSREAAEEIDGKLPANMKVSSASDLLKCYREKKLDSIHGVTKKELIKLFSEE